jgi:L-malate glycosyltransferase
MLKQYRLPLFVQMGEQLENQGHELRVVCGSPPAHELSKGDNVFINQGYCLVENSRWFFKGKLHFVPNALRHILWADFVITEQANRHIHNYLLIILRLFNFKQFGYWGHGRNRQGNSNSLREQIKMKLSTHCDWWFAYTQGVADYLITLGYSSSKITVLNNSIDTSEFKTAINFVTQDQVCEFKQQIEIPDDALIGLYCGNLFADKKIEFLLNAAALIHQQDPKFVLLVVGNGKERQMVEHFANRYSFIKYLGTLFGVQKALAFKSAQLFLCPGLVGLAILDAFTAELPFFTCDLPHHGPEIEYLEDGYNGVMTTAVEDIYAQAVVDILNSPDELSKLQKNAMASGSRFSIENMTNHFVEGIQNYFNSRIG